MTQTYSFITIFKFIFEPNSKFYPLTKIINFYNLVIFGDRYHQISSLPLFVVNIFKRPFLKPIFNFFEFLKANMVKNPERVMTIYFLSRYFYFKGPKSWNIMHKKLRDCKSQFEAKMCIWSKSWRKQTQTFWKMGSVFLYF